LVVSGVAAFAVSGAAAAPESGAVVAGAAAGAAVSVVSALLELLVPELQAATNKPNAIARTPIFNTFFIVNEIFRNF
jgi:hypothetical protein